jgi:hypothetical protein
MYILLGILGFVIQFLILIILAAVSVIIGKLILKGAKCIL